MSTPVHHIAIVGSGAAAVAALHYVLAETPTNLIEITLIGDQPFFGAGLAYSTHESNHLLNLSVNAMSMPDHESFHAWLTKRLSSDLQTPVKKTSYLPRYYFGEYLHDIFQVLLKKAHSNNIRINKIKGRIQRIHYHEERFHLSTALGQKITSNKVMLCLGCQPPLSYSHLLHYPHYTHSPWPFDHVLKKLHSNNSVAILGAHLSAIDVALGLQAHRHSGSMYFVSRSGLLPCVKHYFEPYTLRILTAEKLQQLSKNYTKPISLKIVIDLFYQELSFAYQRKVKPTRSTPHTMQPMQWLIKEIHQVKKPRLWQNVLESLYQIASDIWRCLDSHDQAYFMQHYFHEWMRRTASFPVENAKQLLRLIQANQLNVLGGIQAINFDSHRQQFQLSFAQSEPLYVDQVINATGSSVHFSEKSDPLLKQLLQDGLITAHPLGGIQINPDTMQVTYPESIPLYVLGDMTLGTCLTVNDFPAIRRQAEKATQHLLKVACDYKVDATC